MRVLYFTRDYTPHDRRFLSALAETGHTIGFLRLERRGHALEDRPLPPQIQAIRWAGGQAPFRWRDFLRLRRDLQRVTREFQPDLIHAGPVQTSALLAALSGFRPLVSMSWGSDLLVDAGRSAFYRWATRTTLKRSAVLVGDCEPVRRKAIEYGMPDERIVTFPWGVDLEHFRPQGYERPADAPFTLLSTRSWEPLLGVDLIARAFIQAVQMRPPELPELCLVMLGNGSLAPEIHRLFSQAGLVDRVRFPGQVSQTEQPRYYQNADLYVTASHSDGTSISLLEAMACGRPALVSDIPGNREWIAEGVQGWMFPDGNVAALRDGILRAASERSRLPDMGRAARQLAEQHADWKKNFQELLKAYELAVRYQVK